MECSYCGEKTSRRIDLKCQECYQRTRVVCHHCPVKMGQYNRLECSRCWSVFCMICVQFHSKSVDLCTSCGEKTCSGVRPHCATCQALVCLQCSQRLRCYPCWVQIVARDVPTDVQKIIVKFIVSQKSNSIDLGGPLSQIRSKSGSFKSNSIDLGVL